MISRRDLILRIPAAAALSGAWAALAGASDSPAANPVACQMNAWQIKPGDFSELLARVADLKGLGFEAFECNVRFIEGEFAQAEKARARIAETGLRFYGPHTGLRFKLDELKRYIDGAAALGAGRMALSGSGKSLAKDGKLDPKALGEKVDAITALAKHCRQAGLRLAYHNHASEFASDAAEINELLRQTDPELVFFLFDIGHAYRENCDVAAFLLRHHQRIDALHVRDIRNDKQVPLGQGELDLDAVAAAIRQTNWPGYLTLEEESLKSPDRAYVESMLTAGRQQIRKHFGV